MATITIKQAVDLKIGDWLVTGKDVARCVTGIEVHQRGDDLMDGDVRVTSTRFARIYRHDDRVTVIVEWREGE